MVKFWAAEAAATMNPVGGTVVAVPDAQSEVHLSPVPDSDTIIDNPSRFVGFGAEDLRRPASAEDERRYTAVLIVVDFITAAAALVVALAILAGISGVKVNGMGHFAENFERDATFPLAVVLALAMSGSYRSTRNALRTSIFLGLKDLAFAIGTGCVLALGLGISIHVISGRPEPVASQLLLAATAAAALVPMGRAVVQASMNARAVSRVIVVGKGALVDRITTCVRLHKGMEIVGRVVDERDAGEGTIGTFSDLPYLCDEYDIDRIIIAFPDSINRSSVQFLRQLQDRVHISVVPRYFDLVSIRTRLTDLSGIPMVELAPTRPSVWSRGFKRGFDLAISTGSLALLTPLFLAIAVGIRCTSSGPVFFRQRRVGKDRQPFTVYKFRTMRQVNLGTARATTSSDAESDLWPKDDGPTPLHLERNKLADESRITALGRFLRKTGLDELPQLLNVIQGNMSIVGPRPFVEEESDWITGWRARRFEVRPGITGLWQVSGRNELSAYDLVQLDYIYVSSWSMWWDLKILWDTPRAMVRGLGAY